MENFENQNQQNVSVNEIISGTIKGLIGFMRKELIFRGILFLILGILMLFRPGQTMVIITITLGVLILADGLAMLISALKYHGDGKALMVINAVFFILLGIVCCTSPLVMNIVWVIMIGIWEFFSGIQCLSFRSSAGTSATISGILSIIAGLFLISMPVFGLMTLMWIMGLVSFVSGISAIVLGIKLKKALK